MRRAYTEITEGGERTENYKSIRQELQKKRMIQAVLRALTTLGDLGVDASLSPLTHAAPAQAPALRRQS